MTIRLSETTEKLLERELQRRGFSDANELIVHALALVEAEHTPASQDEVNDWLLRNKHAINAALDESFAEAERGEGHSAEQSRTLLAQHRSARKANGS